MKANMGVLDKATRMLIVITIGVLYFTKVISGTAAIVLGIIAVIFVVTSFVGFCPLYALLGINTGKKKE